MGWGKICAFVGGVALTTVVTSKPFQKVAHDVGVKVAYGAMRACDAIAAANQDIKDEAEDLYAEAKRKARIDEAVAERLADYERKIRAEVTQQVDADSDFIAI